MKDKPLTEHELEVLLHLTRELDAQPINPEGSTMSTTPDMPDEPIAPEPFQPVEPNPDQVEIETEDVDTETTEDEEQEADEERPPETRMYPPRASPLARLNAALAQAQGEFPPIPRDKTVTVQTKTGGAYSFSYAPLDTILAACRPALAKHGLALVQQLENNGVGPAIRTELRHKNGGVIGSSFPLLNVPESPQQLGSLLTYLRRYAITAILGIAAEEDADAQQATRLETKAKDLTEPQRKKIYALKSKLIAGNVFDQAQFDTALNRDYGTARIGELSRDQAADLITRLEQAERELPDREPTTVA